MPPHVTDNSHFNNWMSGRSKRTKKKKKYINGSLSTPWTLPLVYFTRNIAFVYQILIWTRDQLWPLSLQYITSKGIDFRACVYYYLSLELCDVDIQPCPSFNTAFMARLINYTCILYIYICVCVCVFHLSALNTMIKLPGTLTAEVVLPNSRLHVKYSKQCLGHLCAQWKYHI